MAGITGAAPPNRPTHTSLPPLRSADRPKENVAAAPTKSITAAAPALARMKALVASASVGSRQSAAPASRARSHLLRSISATTGLTPRAAAAIRTPDGRDGARDLVAEHAWRRDATTQVELVAVAEIEVAVVQVNVAVTQAAAADTHDDFTVDGMRRFAQHLGQGLPERVKGIAEHGSHLMSCPAHSSGVWPLAPR